MLIGRFDCGSGVGAVRSVIQLANATDDDHAAQSGAVANKAGAAFRQVSQIKQKYSRQIQASSDTERQREPERQADDASIGALEGQGLSVGQYNRVIRLAQADPEV